MTDRWEGGIWNAIGIALIFDLLILHLLRWWLW